MASFPRTPSLSCTNMPMRFEADIADLVIDGEEPPTLDGSFYRVQPDPQFPSRLGDDIGSQVSMLRFRDNKVNFNHRWVHTDKWKLERTRQGAVRRLSQSADRR